MDSVDTQDLRGMADDYMPDLDESDANTYQTDSFPENAASKSIQLTTISTDESVNIPQTDGLAVPPSHPIQSDSLPVPVGTGQTHASCTPERHDRIISRPPQVTKPPVRQAHGLHSPAEGLSRRMTSHSGGIEAEEKTQEFSPHFFEEYEANRRMRDSHTTPHKTALAAGEDGHARSLEGMQQDMSDDEHDITKTVDMPDVISPDESRHLLLSDLTRFTPWKTPASESKKAGFGPSSSPSRRLPNPFARKTDSHREVMGFSQLFDNTQGALTPLEEVATSDPLSARPSPDGLDWNNRDPAPQADLSSPSVTEHSAFARAVTEPHSHYVSIEESQRMRQEYLQKQTLSSAKPNEEADDFDDEFDRFEEELRIKRRRLMEKDNKETTIQFASLTAPARKPTSASKGRRTMHRPLPPLRAAINAKEATLNGTDSDKQDKKEETEGAAENKEEAETQDVSDSGNPPRYETGIEVKATPEMEHKHCVEQKRKASISDSVDNVAVANSQPSLPQQHFSGSQDLSQPQLPGILSSVNWRVRISQSQTDPKDMEDSSSLPPPPPSSSIKELSSPSTSQTDRPIFGPSVTNPQTSNAQQQQAILAERSSPPLLVHRVPPIEDHRTVTNIEAQIDKGRQNNTLGEGHQVTSEPGCAMMKVSEAPTALVALEAPETPLPSKASSLFRPGYIIPQTSPFETSDFTSPLKARSNRSKQHQSDDTRSLDEEATPRASNQGRGATQLERNSDSETAQIRMTGPQNTDGPEQARRHSAPASPEKNRLRTLSEIAADPTPPGSLGASDMDFRIMSSQDQEFHDAVSSSPVIPPRKRQRAYSRALRETEAKINRQAPKAVTESIEYDQLEDEPPHKRARRMTANAALSTATQRGKYQARRLKKPGKPFSATIDGPGISGKGKPKLVKLAKDRLGEREHRDGSKRKTTQVPISESKQMCPSLGNDKEIPVPHVELDTARFVAPTRVLARFNGTKCAYYPAKCILAIAPNQARFKVRFDDGTVDILDQHNVRRFELKVGDVVKVDLPKIRTKNYVVCSFSNRAPNPEGTAKLSENAGHKAEDFETDVFGHQKVILAQKQRDSLPTDFILDEIDTIEVAISSVYITQSSWHYFEDRPYKHPNLSLSLASRDMTPAKDTPTPITSASLSRKGSPRFATPTSSTASLALFSNMVFAVSYVANDKEKSGVTNDLKTHGARILEDGFEEIIKINSKSQSLELVEDAKALGFACLIADRHSRRAKYMQALALGLPCLAGRWVEDCVNKQELIDWEPYLLSSGDSTYLGGAVKSRCLQAYPARVASLSQTISSRRKLLNGHSILLVTGKGKAEERRKAYLFLNYALGADDVKAVANLDSAKTVLASENSTGKTWSLVQVEGSEHDAQKALFENGTVMDKKRKWSRNGHRNSTRENSTASSLGVSTTWPKVVGDEFVVQSLILGRLVE
ncbi:MAG: hypothetical protein M1824_004034 [Vezdaea acicularis]|nr:MAG: hypothetical protein M1824_004034 [Vezdaea acicularis]